MRGADGRCGGGRLGLAGRVPCTEAELEEGLVPVALASVTGLVAGIPHSRG
jgi:hypothetical protein